MAGAVGGEPRCDEDSYVEQIAAVVDSVRKRGEDDGFGGDRRVLRLVVGESAAVEIPGALGVRRR